MASDEMTIMINDEKDDEQMTVKNDDMMRWKVGFFVEASDKNETIE